jgi:hypothetical protein
MIPRRVRRRAWVLLLVLGAGAQGGCVTRWLGLGGEPSVEGSQGSVPLAKVERLMDSFAERQVTLVADACDSIKREARDPEQRRMAHHLKLANGTAVYDIVTEPDPLRRLADLYVLVELEYLVWVTEGRAVKRFGDAGGGRLAAASEESSRAMSHLADLAMKPERRRQFDELILKWRERNPDVEFVAGIRFGALAGVAGKSFLESASSLFDVINPISDTSESVERARILADRAFFYSKRFLKLADWQAEAALDNTLAKPEVRGILSDVDRSAASAEQISRTIRELPDRIDREREELLNAWDERRGELIEPVREIRATLVEARELAARTTEAGRALEQTFRALHEVLEASSKDKSPGAAPARPFDIREYTEAAAQVREAAGNGTGLLREGRDFVDHLVWRLAELIALFFVLLVGYRVVIRWFRPGTRPPRPPEEGPFGSPT